MENWESLIAARQALHGDFKDQRVQDALKRRKLMSRAAHRKRNPEQFKRYDQNAYAARKNNPEYVAYKANYRHEHAAEINDYKKSWNKTEKGKACIKRQTEAERKRIANDPDYREHVKARRKAWREANRERILEHRRLLRSTPEGKAKIREQNKRYREKQKAKAKEIKNV